MLPVLAPLLLAVPLQGSLPQEAPLASWVDVDLDGRLDLFLSDAAGDRLLLGTAGGGFVDGAEAAGLDTRRGSRLAIWADYDLDGWPDLYRVRASGVGELMRNMADGTFAPVGEFAGLPDAHGVLEARWLDVEEDGVPDLALWTVDGPLLARGRAGGTFETAVFAQPRAGSPVAVAPVGPAPDGTDQPAETGALPSGGSAMALTPSSITPSAAGARGSLGASPKCPVALDDAGVVGSCLQASSIPTLGMLYPLSSALFVTPAGSVGIGTTAPSERLDVAGTLEADGLRMPTGASQGRVLTSDGLGNASWQPVPVTGINGGGTTYRIPRFTAPGTLGDSAIRETSSGQVSIGTSSSTATLGVQGDLQDRALRLVGSGTNGSGSKLLFGEGDDLTYIAEAQDDTLFLGAPGGVGIGPGNVGIHLQGFLQATHSLTVGPQGLSNQDVLRLLGPLGLFAHGARLSFGDGHYVELEEDADDHLRVFARFGTLVETDTNAANPSLRVVQGTGSGTASPALNLRNTSTGAGIALFSEAYGTDANTVITNYGTGPLIKAFVNGALKFMVKNDGTVVCNQLEINGGADLAEPFDTPGPVDAGTVLVIDPERPGELRPSAKPYDTRVAGVASGAGGIRPGLSLRQTGAAEGGTPVALSGRVYVRCSAENGPVRPGDLLTSADLPGHAMRASDPERAFGSVLGKAMTGLEEGTGLVLCLVSLQ